MTPLPRVRRPAVLPAAIAIAASAVLLTAGCQSSSASSAASAGPASSVAAAVPSAIPGASAAIASAAAGASGAIASAVGAASSALAAITGGAVSSGGPGVLAGSSVYLALGGEVGGTAWHAPSCAQECVISGDSTTFVSDMTWPSWTGIEALGTGIEKIDDCTPNCAAGKLHAVKVAVFLTKPVHVCVDGTRHWYWTQVSFSWPDGLPAAFQGANAPTNPLVYSGIASQSKSCAS